MNGSSRPPTGPNTPGRRLVTLGLAALMLSACATSHQGKSTVVSASVSDVYSDADMQLYLATVAGIPTPCVEQECERNRAFDQQAQQLGARIAATAFVAYPDLVKRVSRFEFEVVEKEEPGITSNASGRIVILRGTQQIGLNEGALAFVIAREMGHVISQHHDENATTRILFSVAIGVLFPALNLFSNTAAVAQATSASTISTAAVATTAASTATSYLGAKLLLDNLKPEQLSEADQVALTLLGSMGWGHHDIAQALESSAAFDSSNSWAKDFQLSVAQVKSLEGVSEPGEPLEPIEAVTFEEALPEMQESTEEMVEITLALPSAESMEPPGAAVESDEVARPLAASNEEAMSHPAPVAKKPVRDTVKRKVAKGSKSRVGKKAKPGKKLVKLKKPGYAKIRRVSRTAPTPIPRPS